MKGTTINNGVSIIICCYNSADRLPATLKHIAIQKATPDIPWEVIIVNNNSTDNTVEVSKQEWAKYNCTVPFIIVDEPDQGLSNARKKGVNTANYEYLIFCDDDNWLDSDFFQIAFDIMESNNKIGILGGQSTAVCEIEPPTWFEDKKEGFAIGNQGSHSGEISNRGYIWGAGMVLRKSGIQSIYKAGIKSLLSGRKGLYLSSGDDSEICKWFLLLGYKLWYDEHLIFKHFIPQERLTNEYISKLWEGFTASNCILTAYDRILSFKQELDKIGRLKLLIKTIAKLVLGKIQVTKFKNQLYWYLQDLQLCVNSIIIYDHNLSIVQKNFLILLQQR